MGNRLLDLERDVRHARARAQSLARQKSVRLAPGTRSFSTTPVNFRVPGLVPIVAQPTGMTCWAAVTTILYSWKAQQSLSIETVLAQIGQRWLDLRNRPNVREQGLGPREKDQFLSDAGLYAMYGHSLPLTEWERLLRTHGPLWVTTDEDPDPTYGIHARVLAGLHGDGTPAGTRADIIDPANGGSEYTEPFDVFLRKFEEEVRNPKRPVRVQIVHFRDAVSRTRSLSLSFDRKKFFDGYRAKYGSLKQGQVDGLNALLAAVEADPDVSDVRWVAYMLATVKHECADTWQPIEEYGKGKGHKYGNPVTVTDPDGNTYTNVYYGRGYVQLTWEANYRKMGSALGNRLHYEPALALQPDVAYRIMSLGMRRGDFTGKKLADYISGTTADYVNARRIINGTDRADLIAGYARDLEAILRAAQ
ncbi:MAG TPA: papain-like cysteine protease family protein [Longimicrobium sp.]